ncbi:MAG: hypothetical protein IJH37_03150 [Clostridia bacterium]|nr:hypothetical protein [Clostridia bacterium]
MNIILELLKEFLLQIICTIVLSSFLITKLHTTIRSKSIGIKNIHKRGMNVKNLEKSIKKASIIKVLAFMPYYFTFDHKELLVNKVREGCSLQFLACNKDSLLLKELCQIERHVDNDIADLFDPFTNLLESIKTDAGVDTTGSIELRTYNTEIRNPVIICCDKDGKKSAFLTISMPPKRSIDAVMLEYVGDGCDSVINYFDVIWNRHSEHVALKLK